MPVPAPSPDARAVVTGASQNIGEALATELAARGHNLIITARREDVLTSLAQRLTGALRGDRRGACRRPHRPRRQDTLCAELAQREISILCANAGTATFGPVIDLDPAGEKAQVQLNVLGVHDLVLAVLPGMVKRGSGGILTSGSAAGNSPIPNNSTYAASKAFANTFSESLRGELKGAGVHVTVLAPGPVRTDLPDASEQSLVERLIPDFLGSQRNTPPSCHWTAWRRTRCVWFPASRRKPCRWPAATRRVPSSPRSSEPSTRSSAAARGSHPSAAKQHSSSETSSNALPECRFGGTPLSGPSPDSPAPSVRRQRRASAEDAAGDLAADHGARRAHGALERRTLDHLLEDAGLFGLRGGGHRLDVTRGLDTAETTRVVGGRLGRRGQLGGQPLIGRITVHGLAIGGLQRAGLGRQR